MSVLRDKRRIDRDFTAFCLLRAAFGAFAFLVGTYMIGNVEMARSAELGMFAYYALGIAPGFLTLLGACVFIIFARYWGRTRGRRLEGRNSSTRRISIVSVVQDGYTL